MVIGVCSNKPRPSVQNNYTGPRGFTAVYGRDPWHVKGENGRTLCGINSSEWLTIGDLKPDGHLCHRCRRKLEQPPMKENG